MVVLVTIPSSHRIIKTTQIVHSICFLSFGFVLQVLVRWVRSAFFNCVRLFPGRLSLFYCLFVGIPPGWLFDRRREIDFGFCPEIGLRGGNGLACFALRLASLWSGRCRLRRRGGRIHNPQPCGRGNGSLYARFGLAASRCLYLPFTGGIDAPFPKRSE